MPHPAGRKEQSQERLLASAGRGFRVSGYGGLGIDRLAKDAGVTSGAFYAHFQSKALAFKHAVASGLTALRRGIEHLRTEHRDAWLASFIDFYLTERVTCDLSESCALQSLTSDVARADADTKETFESELAKILDAATAGGAAENRETITALLALLTGGVSMARAVSSKEAAAEIIAATRKAAMALIGQA